MLPLPGAAKELMLKATPPENQAETERATQCTLRELFDSEETRLLRYAFSLTGRRAVSEEIVQDAFLQLHARGKDVESPKAWLIRCVRNRALNYLRGKRREVLDADDGGSTSLGTDVETPAASLVRIENARMLREMLTSLNEVDQQLVTLKYFQNLTYRQISQQTGLSISNVGYRLHHILKELAGKLRSLGIDGES